MAASVVLNGATSSTRVSATTRQRILETAERLGYRPNAVARGLSRRRMDTIGVVAIIDGGELNLYFLELLNGILEETARRGQNTTIFSIQQWDEEARILQCLDGRVDGMILIAPKHLTAAFAQTLHQHTPYVAIHGNEPPFPAYNIEVDNEGGAYLLVRHMIAQGHRRIAHFMGGTGLRGTEQRFGGYRRALAEAGIAEDPQFILPGGFSAESGRYRAQELLARRDAPLPTAIFCANDAIAVGCMEVLQGHGLAIPGDISIGGFDGVLSASMTQPQLTTIRQPFRRMGARAVEYLLAQIKVEPEASAPSRDEQQPPQEEIFDVDLIVRGTVAPPAPHPVYQPNFS